MVDDDRATVAQCTSGVAGARRHHHGAARSQDTASSFWFARAYSQRRT